MSILPASGATSKFTFGSQPSKTDAPAFSFGSATTTGGFSFGAPKPAASKPVDVPKLESKEFGFVFKPKSPGKAKSPLKGQIEGYEEVSDDENVEEEENNTYFTPGNENNTENERNYLLINDKY